MYQKDVITTCFARFHSIFGYLDWGLSLLKCLFIIMINGDLYLPLGTVNLYVVTKKAFILGSVPTLTLLLCRKATILHSTVYKIWLRYSGYKTFCFLLKTLKSNLNLVNDAALWFETFKVTFNLYIVWSFITSRNRGFKEFGTSHHSLQCYKLNIVDYNLQC